MKIRELLHPRISILQTVDGFSYQIHSSSSERSDYLFNPSEQAALNGAEVVDLDLLSEAIRSMFSDVLGGYALTRPAVDLYLPYGLSSIQKNAYQQVLEMSGAHSVVIKQASHEFIKRQGEHAIVDGVCVWLGLFGSDITTVHDGTPLDSLAIGFSGHSLANDAVRLLKKSGSIKHSQDNTDRMFRYMMESRKNHDAGVRLVLRNGEEEDMAFNDLYPYIQQSLKNGLVAQIAEAVRVGTIATQSEIAKKGLLVAGKSQLLDLTKDSLQSQLPFGVVCVNSDDF